jgi:uncharacterized membrane protein
MSLGSLTIDWLELTALAVFLYAWAGYSWASEKFWHRRPSLISVMANYRLAWMEEMLRRDNRVVDATMLSNLMRSIAFFASTAIFLLIGAVSLLGYREQSMEVITSIPFAYPPSPLMWEAKLFILAVIFVYGFFKFTWSLRQYNYACVFIAACPAYNAVRDDWAEIARHGATLLENASKHFNLGMRAYYFGLAALAGFLHPVLFMCATVLTLAVLYRREFLSHTLHTLCDLQFGSRPVPKPQQGR